MKKLKILAIGPNWRGSISGSFFNGFSKLGHDVKVIETDTYFYNYSIPERVYMKLTKMPLKSKFQEFNRKIEMSIASYQPDILFVIKGLWVSEKVIQYAKVRNIRTIHLHTDSMFEDQYHTSPILNTAITSYDCVITTKQPEIKKYNQLGCNHVRLTKFAYDPDIHRPVALAKQELETFQTDVAFVGRMESPRAESLERIAQENYNMKVWGTKWDKLPKNYRLNQHCQGRPIFCEDMSKVFQGAKISVGFLTSLSSDQHTGRTFEIPACRGFFLGERTDEHMDIFKEGVEADFFSSTEELLEKTAFYTKNENAREQIVQKGYEKVIQMNETYESRVQGILDFMS